MNTIQPKLQFIRTTSRRLFKSLYLLGRRLTSLRFIIKIFVVILLIIFVIAFLAGYTLKDLRLSIPAEAPRELESKVEQFYTLHDFVLRGERLQLFNIFRIPLLLFIGTFMPLFYYVFHFGEPLVTNILRPYFYLAIIHALSLIAANLLIGPGSLAFVGAAYSVIRVFQLFYLNIKTRRSLISLSPGSGRHKLAIRLFRILKLLSVAWIANSIFLAVFVILVTYGLFNIGLTYEVS